MLETHKSKKSSNYRSLKKINRFISVINKKEGASCITTHLPLYIFRSRLSNCLMVRCSFMRYDFITWIRLIGLRVLLLESRLSNHLTVRCSFMRYDFITRIRLIGFESVLAWKSIIKSLNGEMFFYELWFYNQNTLNWFESVLAWK